jgi:uncharacterized protein YcbK (DUF882 family)
LEIMTHEHITPNFTRGEFACACGCGYAEVDLGLVRALQLLRDQLGKPVRVISGCRCPSHNREAGGGTYSQHLLGMAADVAVAGIPIRQVCQAAMQIPAFKGFGLDEQRGMLHLDVREDLAHWVYLDGKAIGGWPEELKELAA